MAAGGLLYCAVKQARLGRLCAIHAASQVLVSQFCHFTSARCAPNEAFLYEERLIHLLHRAGVLAHGGGYGGDAHGATLELVDDGKQNFVVNLVESVLVDVQSLEGE